MTFFFFALGFAAASFTDSSSHLKERKDKFFNFFKDLGT